MRLDIHLLSMVDTQLIKKLENLLLRKEEEFRFILHFIKFY